MKFLQTVILLCLSIATGACGDTTAFASAPRDVVRPVVGTAYILLDPTQRQQYTSGSAVIIAPGYALTADHVVRAENATSLYPHLGVTLHLYRDDHTAVEVTVVKTDSTHDLALIKGDFKCPCATMFMGTVPIDNKIITVGYPLYSKYKLQVLSEGTYQGNFTDKLVTTAQAAPGSSGGGVFMWTPDGYKLISMVEGIAASQGDFQVQMHAWLVFSTSAHTIKEFLTGTGVESLVKGLNVTR